jgi:hypothetical protein
MAKNVERTETVKIRVFRFRYFDRGEKGFKLSVDYATEKAIDQMRAEPVYALALEVDDSEVTLAGLLKRRREAG